MHALSIRGLRKTYKNGIEALSAVDLEVQDGDFFALLGPNGAGKSTIIGIVCSLINKTSGKVKVFGHDLDTDPEQVKRCIGLVPQEFNFNQFQPVWEIVVNQAGYYGIPRKEAWIWTEQFLRQLELWDKRNLPARELSGGMKRRLMIARALVHRPKLLILDEPTAGVDIEIRISMWKFLRDMNAAGTTIILTTHYLEEVERLCRNLAIIDQGQIVERSSINEILTRLHAETLILSLRNPLKRIPELSGYLIRRLDDTNIEVIINETSSINCLFNTLSNEGIEVVSVRNKQNRLEQLLISQLVANRIVVN